MPSARARGGKTATATAMQPRIIAALLLVAFVAFVAIVVSGCGSTYHTIECFAWAADTACPTDDVAVLYLGGALQGCDAQLLSIDAPPTFHAQRGCCYEVTVNESGGCDPPL